MELSTLKFPVVGIGASAGGLQAIDRLLADCPATTGMAFVVVLHLSPTNESSAAKILQRSTGMTVLQLAGRTKIEPNHVYVIPPNRQLLMDDNHLFLDKSRRTPGRQVAIDVFFRTLAEAHQSRAVGVVMSGTGSDGTLGARRLKELGAVVIAQNPEDAEYDGMPRSAIAGDVVDFALPASQIPQKLIDLWSNLQRMQLPSDEGSEKAAQTSEPADPKADDDEALRQIMTTLRTRTGHDFRHYKRATVLRRLERRLQVNGKSDLTSYHRFLLDTPAESQALLKDLLISVTNFFRDAEAFEALEREILPGIFKARKEEDQVRAWVAGCATGEEAYTLAMLLSEQADAQSKNTDMLVFATDIDEAAIAVGRVGTYPESITTDVPPQRLRLHFSHEQGCFRLKKSVRERVLFAVQNILRDPPFSRLDLICCRNVLIYLDRQVQVQILQMFHFALRPGGHLMLGSSESADAASELFTVVDKKNRIYKARSVARALRHVPMMPLGGGDAKVVRTEMVSVQPRPLVFAELHDRLRQQYAPPSVLINLDHTIVHVSEGAGRFLRHRGGTPSHNLLVLIHPDLKLELRTALFQVEQTGNSVEARRVRLEKDGGPFYVNMTIRPVREIEEHGDLVLVLFNEVEDTTGGEGEHNADSGRQKMIQQLEDQLSRSREQVQNILEQSETSNEEMKASNEELQAINEELRSATEELETSKEEAQSINEELITVNHELKVKIEETGSINDDLQNLIASTDIATVFIDRGMRIMRYTPRTTDLFSLIPTDVGRSLLDITHRLEYDRLTDDVEEVFRSLQPMEREVHGPEGRGYMSRIRPYRTTDDRIDGAIITFVDVTSLRRAEKSVEAGEARMRLVADSMREYAIVTTDMAGLIASWSPGAVSIFGLMEADAIGQPLAILYSEEERRAGVPEQELQRARLSGSTSDERWHTRSDGLRLYCSGVTSVMSDGINSPSQGFVKITRDHTAAKKLEIEHETLLMREQASRAAAQAADRVKDEFLAIVSHELKHPLNLININAELLSRAPDLRAVPLVRKATTAIRCAVDSQAQVINDMLDLSRINTGNLTLKRSAVVLDDVVETVFAIFEKDAFDKKLELSYRRGDVPSIIHADPVRIEQIAWNLISNAIKFTPSGGRIEVAVTRNDPWALLTVTDTGLGIPEGQLDDVFGLFQRGDNRLQKEDGLGIGLALVDQLSRLHGGHAEAKSSGEGHGATFLVFIPLSDSEVDRQEPSEAASGMSVDGLRILVVDDTPETTEVLGDLLKIEGAIVRTADSGAAAIQRLADEDFDLLLSDLGMPEINGYELITRLRVSTRNESIAAIALSGFGRNVDAKRAIKSGFDAHLSKPVSFDALLKLMRKIVTDRSLGMPHS